MKAQEGVRGRFCKQLFLAACFLDLWIPRIQADRIKIVLIPENPTEGQNLTFSVENVQGDIREVTWFRGMSPHGSTRIFSYFPGMSRPQRNGVQYTNREFGFPNGSLHINGIRPNDVGQYSTIILLRPKQVLNASIDLRLASPTQAATTVREPPPTKEQPRKPSALGWIVAGVVVGVLLCGAIGAILVHRFVLQKTEAGRGVAGPLDAIGKKPPAHQHDDKEPIYEVMDSPVESPKNFLPVSGPLTTLPETFPRLDTNYMDLLYKTESVYAEMKR